MSEIDRRDRFDIESDAWLQDIYVGEIQLLCEQVTIAIEGLNRSFATHNTKVTFFYLRSIVSSCATISHFFWPPPTKNKRASRRAELRGKVLRRLFSIKDDSILQDRTFRHHLIHIDERIDLWAEESKNRAYIRQNIGPRDMIGGAVIETKDFLEHYEYESHTFLFRGDEFNVQAIVDEVTRIAHTANELKNSCP